MSLGVQDCRVGDNKRDTLYNGIILLQEIRNIFTIVDFKAEIQTLNIPEYEAAVPLLVKYRQEGSVGDQTTERPLIAKKGKVDVGDIEGIELAISRFRSSTTVRL